MRRSLASLLDAVWRQGNKCLQWWAWICRTLHACGEGENFEKFIRATRPWRACLRDDGSHIWFCRYSHAYMDARTIYGANIQGRQGNGRRSARRERIDGWIDGKGRRKVCAQKSWMQTRNGTDNFPFHSLTRWAMAGKKPRLKKRPESWGKGFMCVSAAPLLLL